MNLLETLKNLFGMTKKAPQESGVLTITVVESMVESIVTHSPFVEYQDNWNKVLQESDGLIKIYECSGRGDWRLMSANRLDRADRVLLYLPDESTSDALHRMGITLDMLCKQHDVLAVIEADRQALLEATKNKLREEWCVPKNTEVE